MDKIVVVGGGTMGAGIAFVAASAGFTVDLVEPDPLAAQRAGQRIVRDAERANDAAIAARVTTYASLPAGTTALLAIEAVPETIDLKREVLAGLAKELGADTLLATNTSSLCVGDIAASVPAPHRVLGLHFFNPPARMALVEVVRAAQTSDETIVRARSIIERMGKTAIVTADTPGFVVNRVARPYYLQALRALSAGAASAEELDRLARGIGFPMGPFELMDLIGMDVNLATSVSVYERTGAPRLAPVALQEELVRQQRLGRKTQHGFYEYADGVPTHDDDTPSPDAERRTDEKILVIGYAGIALELRDLLSERHVDVAIWENEDLLDQIPLDTSIVVDVGDGVSDRGSILGALDSLLLPEAVIFADAYATGIEAAAKRMQHPERLVGYGILGALANQRVVEIVDAASTGDDALESAQDLFASIGKGVVLVEDTPGLFLGRTVGSIVNEAVYVVNEEGATPEDVDTAMRLGTRYPLGPIAWGRQIGGDRITRILQRLAGAEGAAFAPHRALRLLDVDDDDAAHEPAVSPIFGGTIDA